MPGDTRYHQQSVVVEGKHQQTGLVLAGNASVSTDEGSGQSWVCLVDQGS